ncbi:hypothetical protein AVEN_213279-1 [Araneus ventricosus]|uniref:Uncharacterized protein n=1 Tax=Araneus ventricosus TaxID=182803 RepID=A0A4Y2QHZ9_ARAVE|nr:hypothetical protein AVEN_213279-1 [Araneus ventricosus]
MHPVPHGSGIPIPKPPEKLKDISSDSEEDDGADDDDDFNASGSNDPQLFSQSELNDLVRDLGLPKNSTELLGSRLNEKTYWNLVSLFHGLEEEKRIFFLIFLKMLI